MYAHICIRHMLLSVGPAKGTNMNYCGGFFKNWTFAAVWSLANPLGRLRGARCSSLYVYVCKQSILSVRRIVYHHADDIFHMLFTAYISKWLCSFAIFDTL